MSDSRQRLRCTNCGRRFAVAPDRDEPAGGTECWSCAFDAVDVATMKAEASDAHADARRGNDDGYVSCVRDDSTECSCPRCVGAEDAFWSEQGGEM